MKTIVLLASITLATYAAPITASFTCEGSFADGRSEITVAGAVYGGFNNDGGCGVTLFPDRLSMTVGTVGATVGGGSLNGYQLIGSGPGTISNLKAVFDLDPFGYASGYFSAILHVSWGPPIEFLEVLHVEAFGTYTMTRSDFRTGSLSLTLDTDPNAVVLTPEPSAVIGTTLGLGVLLLNRNRLRVARRQHRIT